ncbi:hypothetical protein MNBD_ALPHA05-572 [hydrothermal vent metagenome]|uniref:Uncharacterized protein n=1 Tax=hydrothermal vent metagenome TaxID=652676 RepID=A0A3B0T4X1_9ZZZZ
MNLNVIKFAGIAGFFAIAGIAYVADEQDKANNYDAVQGRITQVEEICYLEKKIGKKREYSDVLPCETAVALEASHPTWRGFDIQREATITVEYLDPASSFYSKATFVEEYASKEGRYKMGGAYELLAHKLETGKTRKT